MLIISYSKSSSRHALLWSFKLISHIRCNTFALNASCIHHKRLIMRIYYQMFDLLMDKLVAFYKFLWDWTKNYSWIISLLVFDLFIRNANNSQNWSLLKSDSNEYCHIMKVAFDERGSGVNGINPYTKIRHL